MQKTPRSLRCGRSYSVQFCFLFIISGLDRLCGLVLRAPDYRFRSPGFDSRRYRIFWEVVGLERGPLSLVSITEKVPEWKSSGSRSRNSSLTAVRIRCADHVDNLYPQKLALTSLTSDGRLVDTVRLRTKATQFL
jgi:hypothetical protein